MRAIMISDKPKWVAKILNGEKTIEVRKNKALATAIQKLIDKYGYADIYVYCSKDNKIFLRDYRDKKKWAVYWRFVAMEKDPSIVGEEPPILNGKVVFKFRCYKVEEIECAIDYYHECGRDCTYHTDSMCQEVLGERSCLYNDIDEYLDWKPDNIVGYAIHIGDLEIFDKPKELSEFYSIVKEKVKTDCPLNCKGWCITNYDCKYYVEDDCWGGQLACSCPTKEVNIKKQLTKAPQNFVYIESEE